MMFFLTEHETRNKKENHLIIISYIHNIYKHTRQEMDHWSDPLGTESPDMQLD